MDLTDIIIDESLTILQTMEQLDKAPRKILFVQKKECLLASVTDGDIRRWILSNGDLRASIKHAANYHPKYLPQEKIGQAKRFMKENEVEALPILDNSHHIISVIFLDDEELLERKSCINIPVAIMAGGLGTRLYPYTKILPKPLIPIGELPIAEHIINKFYGAGCRQFYLILNHKKNMIKAYFNEIKKDYNVFYIDEKIPLGTGGGLSLLKGKISSTFFLTNCDILIRDDITKIYKFHKDTGNVITMVCSLKNFSIPYGVVSIGSSGEIDALQEKPQLSFFTNTGCYIVEPQVIEDLTPETPLDFTDIILQYKEKGAKVGVYPINESAWLDMGQIDELKNMKLQLGDL